MYQPDWAIRRKIKEYDDKLFFRWNGEEQFFELWRRMPDGDKLITPVTRSIYGPGKREFVEVDERLLYWLYAADAWASGGAKNHALRFDERRKKWHYEMTKSFQGKTRDVAKDFRRAAANFFFTKHGRKNNKAPATKERPSENFPVVARSRYAPRILYARPRLVK